MKALNGGNFRQEVLQSDLPVLVDFYADWCGPCQMLAPVMGQLAEQYAGRVKIATCNVDQAPELAAFYGISSIPALLCFQGGKVRGTSVGLSSKEDLERKLAAWGAV